MESTVQITRLPILNLVSLFIVYFVIHFAIGIGLKIFREKLEKQKSYFDLTEEMVKDIAELEGQVKFLHHLFNWFPAIYVVFLLLYFLA